MVHILFLLGLALRFFRLSDNFPFSGEMGHNYLSILSHIQLGTIPLLGPPTSHPWLYFGPIYYWLFTPVLILGKFDPLMPHIFTTIVLSLAVYLSYWVHKQHHNSRSALISAYLTATALPWLVVTREARFFSFSPLFVFPVISFLLFGRSFLSGLFLGIGLNFHLSSLVLIPVCIYWVFRQNLGLRRFFLGLLIPSLPFILFNANIFKFLAWIPYRPMAHIDIPSFFISILVMVASLYLSRLVFSRMTRLLFYTLAIGAVGVLMHGTPPSHYYWPLLPISISLVSVFLSRLSSRLLLLVILVYSIFSFKYLFSQNWFFKAPRVEYGKAVPYTLQIQLVDEIIAAANGRPFDIKRIGAYDVYEDNFAQNYIYLFWLRGHPVRPGSDLVFTITEDTDLLKFTY